MLEVVLRRLVQAVGVVLVLSLVSFVGVYKIGDPVQLLAHEGATEQEIDEAEQVRRLAIDVCKLSAPPGGKTSTDYDEFFHKAWKPEDTP